VLLPLLEREFNPAIRELLADTAEVARGEEEFWEELIAPQGAHSTGLNPGASTDFPASTGGVSPVAGSLSPGVIDLSALARTHVAVQRRLLRRAAEAAGVHLDLKHVEALRELVQSKSGEKLLELPGGWKAVVRQRFDRRPELRFETSDEDANTALTLNYEHPISIPGELHLRETGTVVRLTLVPVGDGKAGYNREQLLDPALAEKDLLVRNWRPGDRFAPAYGKGPKKVKELLQERHVPLSQRRRWPVLVSGSTLVWVRGVSVAAGFQPPAGSSQGVLVEEEGPGL
jgi:tRNA(Ile)-lysidine synthase